MAYEGYYPVSDTLVGFGGDCASRPFERKGGKVGQPTPGVSGVQLPGILTVNKAVNPPPYEAVVEQTDKPGKKWRLTGGVIY